MKQCSNYDFRCKEIVTKQFLRLSQHLSVLYIIISMLVYLLCSIHCISLHNHSSILLHWIFS